MPFPPKIRRSRMTIRRQRFTMIMILVTISKFEMEFFRQTILNPCVAEGVIQIQMQMQVRILQMQIYMHITHTHTHRYYYVHVFMRWLTRSLPASGCSPRMELANLARNPWSTTMYKIFAEKKSRNPQPSPGDAANENQSREALVLLPEPRFWNFVCCISRFDP